MAELAYLSKDDDCRRAKRAENDVIYTRLALLEPADRIMVEMHLLHGVSYKELGLLTGQKPPVVSRKINNCVRRLLGGQYIVVARNRDSFSQVEMAVAYDSFLLGMGYRRIAIKRGLREGKCRGILKRLKDQINQFSVPTIKGE